MPMTIFEKENDFNGSESWFRNILLTTQKSAIASAQAIGFGDKNLADGLAVKAMREQLNALPVKGHVVMGEGRKDNAPFIGLGERVGQWKKDQEKVDIALDPLEGTSLCAKDSDGAWSVMALAPGGSLLKSDDFYMEKIACGPKAKGALSLAFSVEENIQNLSQVLNLSPSQLKVAVLDRPRHRELIARLRALDVRLKLLEDGDLMASLLCCLEGDTDESLSAVMGIGGVPEGLLAACALKCLNGDFQGRLVFPEDKDVNEARSHTDHLQPGMIYTIEEMASSHVLFCGTGVTDGALLSGVKNMEDYVLTESITMDSLKQEFSIVKTYHLKTDI